MAECGTPDHRRRRTIVGREELLRDGATWE